MKMGLETIQYKTSFWGGLEPKLNTDTLFTHQLDHPDPRHPEWALRQ